MTAAGPAGRIEALDVLRGLAVLGILAVNAQAFAYPAVWYGLPQLAPPVGAAEVASWTAVRVLFEGKFLALFSMLFGVSLFLIGGDGSDPRANRRLMRRLLWLLAFGVVHGALVWYGDILLTYALAGLIVAAARRWPAAALLAVGVSVYAVQAVLQVSPAIFPPDRLEGARRLAAAAFSPETGYTGDFTASLSANFRDWAGLVRRGTLSSVLYAASLMLVGLGLFKAGAFSGRARPAAYVAVAALGGLLLAAVALLTAPAMEAGLYGPAAATADTVNQAGAPLISLAYGGLLLLALRSGARRWVVWLAPVGRMAFTNYLAQSLLMTALFYGGRGPGLFGELGRAELWGVVGAVWALQIAWSRLWLARFRYGPFEWVWRSLTEGRPVPIRGGA